MIEITQADGGVELKGRAVELGEVIYRLLTGKGVKERNE